MICRKLVVLTLLVVSLIYPMPGAAKSLAVSKPNRFGAIESYYRPDEAAELGVGWDRIIFEWRYLQPNGPNDWDTSHVPDDWLQTAADAHREIVGLIKNAPRWATGSDLLGAPPLGLDKPINDPANTFAAFVTKLVSYYGARWNIHHWIIYNEPDIRPDENDQFEFSGDETDYYHVVKVAYKAAHAADPKSVIHLAGFTWWQDVIHNRLLYFERWLRIATQDPEARENHLFFDVLSIHVYTDTSLVWRITNQLKSLSTSMGFSPPVWIDEMNARLTTDGNWQIESPDGTVTLDQQAAYIVQASALGLALNAERIAVYRLYDDAEPTHESWGLIRHDGTRRPAYDAWRTVITEFSPTVAARRVSNHDVTIVTLRQPGRTVSVLWNETDKPLTVRALITPGAKLLSPIGATLDVQTVNYAYEFELPGCIQPCKVQGEPRILIQQGTPQAIYLKRDAGPLRLD